MQVSAAAGEGLDRLGDEVEAKFLSSLKRMELLVPYDEGGRLSELHDLAGEIGREDTPAGVASRLERFSANGRGE